MSKRRLSKRQQSRIAENQRRELSEKLGQADAADTTSKNKCNGRIISHFGQQLDVESLDSAHAGKIIRCHQRANLPTLVTGDRVLWELDGSDTGVILALGERRNLFGRPSAAGNFRPVAANIDLVLVIISPLPPPFMNLIDRYLVAIECLGLEPLLVLNKIDMLDSGDPSELDNMLSVYASIGYGLHRVSALDGSGIDQLEASLSGKTTVLVGQSGVGKSSLINRFGLDAIAVVGPLSSGKAKGTHTTTTAKLFHLANYDLIDSPGIREFSLGHINQQQLFEGFIEFRALVGKCKFRDCSHRAEPECAIQQAVANGEIHQQRLDSYFQILLSMENPVR